jgi:hypothetical protein
LLGLFVPPRKREAVEQVPSQFLLEYCYDPVPSAKERYEAALDLIVQLILADLDRDRSGEPWVETTEGVA